MKDKFNNAVGPQVRTKKRKIEKIPVLAVLSLVAGLQAASRSPPVKPSRGTKA